MPIAAGAGAGPVNWYLVEDRSPGAVVETTQFSFALCKARGRDSGIPILPLDRDRRRSAGDALGALPYQPVAGQPQARGVRSFEPMTSSRPSADDHDKARMMDIYLKTLIMSLACTRGIVIALDADTSSTANRSEACALFADPSVGAVRHAKVGIASTWSRAAGGRVVTAQNRASALASLGQ